MFYIRALTAIKECTPFQVRSVKSMIQALAKIQASSTRLDIDRLVLQVRLHHKHQNRGAGAAVNVFFFDRFSLYDVVGGITVTVNCKAFLKVKGPKAWLPALVKVQI